MVEREWVRNMGKVRENREAVESAAETELQRIYIPKIERHNMRFAAACSGSKFHQTPIIYYSHIDILTLSLLTLLIYKLLKKKLFFWNLLKIYSLCSKSLVV